MGSLPDILGPKAARPQLNFLLPLCPSFSMLHTIAVIVQYVCTQLYMFMLIVSSFAMVGESIAMVGESIVMVGESIAMVGESIAMVGESICSL